LPYRNDSNDDDGGGTPAATLEAGLPCQMCRKKQNKGHQAKPREKHVILTPRINSYGSRAVTADHSLNA
jgi:hypothetical protein